MLTINPDRSVFVDHQPQTRAEYVALLLKISRDIRRLQDIERVVFDEMMELHSEVVNE